jgi:general secretion pathway protein G
MNEQSNASENAPAPLRPKINWSAVVVVLGMAFVLAVPFLLKSAHRIGPAARGKAAKAQIASFGTALAVFKMDNGYFPPGANGLIYLVQRPPGETNWRGPYLEKSAPVDPWGHSYLYECPGRHNPQTHDLSSMGPDGRAGGGDDICNWQLRY